jgi:hypothetical protein
MSNDHPQPGDSQRAFLGPPFLQDLIERAATLMRAQWPRETMVEFDWRADGESRAYRGFLEWPLEAGAPRLVVVDGRSGDFRCASLEGQPFEIDPEDFLVDVVADEIEPDPIEVARTQRMFAELRGRSRDRT